jgi:peptidoglycan-N-acetylglucosamine deacetylase
MTVLSRRTALGAGLALALGSRQGRAEAPAKVRSYAATHGHAPFETAHLLPGDPLDLARVDRNAAATRVIALTIDDGPDANDHRILDILRTNGAKATFFEIGRKIVEHPEITKAVIRSGNEVGNHSLDHVMMSDVPPAEQARNLSETNRLLDRLGAAPAWFRPPFGDFDDGVAALARANGLRSVVWTLDTKDWKGLDAAAIAGRVTANLRPGTIVLMHSTKTPTVEALPTILAEGQRQGYRFVTMTEWYAAMKAASVPGTM